MRAREKRLFTVKAVSAISGMLFLFVYAIEKTNGEIPELTVFFWLQMLTGSAWPDAKGVDVALHPVLFSVGAAVQVMVAAGPLIGFVWLAYELAIDRSKVMDLAQVIKTRDARIKFQLLELIRQKHGSELAMRLAPLVDAAFDGADKRLQEDLQLLLGKDAARTFMAQLEPQT